MSLLPDGVFRPPPPAGAVGYLIVVADNFHYQDVSAHRQDCWTPSESLALSRCRQIVDSSLSDLLVEDCNEAQLIRAYQLFGDDPFIVTLGGASRLTFSAWTYAGLRAASLIEGL